MRAKSVETAALRPRNRGSTQCCATRVLRAQLAIERIPLLPLEGSSSTHTGSTELTPVLTEQTTDNIRARRLKTSNAPDLRSLKVIRRLVDTSSSPTVRS